MPHRFILPRFPVFIRTVVIHTAFIRTAFLRTAFICTAFICTVALAFALTSSLAPAHAQWSSPERLAGLAEAWAPLWVIQMQQDQRSEYLTSFDLDGNLDLADNPARVKGFATPSVLYWWGQEEGNLIFLGFAGYKVRGTPQLATRWVGVLLQRTEPDRAPSFLALVLPRGEGRYELALEMDAVQLTEFEEVVVVNPAVDCDLGCKDVGFVRDESGFHPVVGGWNLVESYCQDDLCKGEVMDLRGAKISPSERRDGRPHPNDRQLLPELVRPGGDSIVYWHTGTEALTSTPDRNARGLLAHNGEVTPYGLRPLSTELGRLRWSGPTSKTGSVHLAVGAARPERVHPALAMPFLPLGPDRP